jgi:hypothetical protein
MISFLFWKTSLRWTILLESLHTDNIAISCRISMEQSTPHLNLDEYFAAYCMPVSLWVHLLTVAKRPLKYQGKNIICQWRSLRKMRFASLQIKRMICHEPKCINVISRDLYISKFLLPIKYNLRAKVFLYYYNRKKKKCWKFVLANFWRHFF